MNNPKEEAKRLVDRFDYQVRDNDGECALTRDESNQCALISIKDTIEWINSQEIRCDSQEEFVRHLIYDIEQVKKEIEALG